MGKFIERLWNKYRVHALIACFLLGGALLVLWLSAGVTRHGLLGAALVSYGLAFLSPGLLAAVSEGRLLKFDPASRYALLLATGLSCAYAVVVFSSL